MSLSGTASPAPNGTNLIKRKRETPNFASASAAEKPMTGSSLLARVHEAEEYLRTRPGVDKSLDDIIGYLSIQHNDPRELRRFEMMLKKTSSKMTWNPDGLGGKGSFRFKPLIPVEDAEQLKSYLQRRTDSVGVNFKDIAYGWPAAPDAVMDMAHRHELLVFKDKKDVMRAVWQDDPTLHQPIALDLQMSWNDITLPANADGISCLRQD
jgi:transcription initiation factor TFIIE subunit beta